MRSHFHPNSCSSQRGVALVIVLSVLLLMSGLLVAFMGRVSTERTAQRAASSTFEAKQAYESAVNLVISQIREATKNEDGDIGWASQPGVIRTFNNRGRDVKVYKLYSQESMQVDAAGYRPSAPAESGFDPSAPDEPIDATYVNLNEPAFTPAPGDDNRVYAHYPIVDPYARKDYRASAMGSNPAKPGHGSVEGFYCTEILHRSGARDQFGNRVLDLPMRVKWLYHMRDGTVSAADSQGVIAGASKENPPVARVAFWTDDESSKINLNTAAENTFWDTPMASTRQESGSVNGDAQLNYEPNNSLHLSSSQPARDEFQRYPGHPATTNLSPALRWLFPTRWTDKEYKEALFRLLPRITGGVGTSVSGSQNSWRLYFHPTSGIRQNNVDPRVAERDRLFASVDEFWFRPGRSPITDRGFFSVFRDPSVEQRPGPASNDAAIPELHSRFGLTPAAVMERLRFFLTATSRSTDLNLYGRPRIPVWSMVDQSVPPTSGTADRRSAYDDMIAFCSTIAGKVYHFARLKPWNQTYDFETAGRTNSTDPVPNGRNKELFLYLQELTSKAMPGTDASFLDKYGADRDQILVEIFDYIRSTNLIDTGNKQVSLPFPPTNFTQYPFAFTYGYDNLPEGDTNKYSGSAKSNLGSGMVVPTVRMANGVPENRGFGRFITVSESGLAFFVDEGTDIPGLDTHSRSSPRDIPIRAILLTEMFTPSIGYPALSEAYAYTVNRVPGAPELMFKPNDPNKPSVPMKLIRGTNNANFVEVDAARGSDGRFFMPTRGFANQFRYDNSTGGSRSMKMFFANNSCDNPLPNKDYSRYPFISQKFYVDATSTTASPANFGIVTAPIQYDIYALNIPDGNLPPNLPPFHPPAGDLVQTIKVNFGTPNQPPMTITMPVPQKFTGAQANTTGSGIFNIVGKALSETNNSVAVRDDWSKMSIRSVEINGTTRADIRHQMAQYNVPETCYSFTGAPNAYASTARQVHNFRAGWGRAYPGGPSTSSGAVSGRLVAGQLHRDKMIDLPQAYSNGLPSINGGLPDFDRGLSKHTDGPFINKADEGNVRFKADDDPSGGGSVPYFRGGGGYDEVGSNFFSPNRIIPSAVMLGSLPTGVKAGRPWETLLFAPPVGSGHRGALSPADHYLLDLFTMPVVEPYAISEPLSTAGRINLNARLAPFGYAKDNKNLSYIDRSTGLHAVLKNLYQFAIHNTAPESGHSEKPLTGANAGQKYRIPLDTFATIEKVVNPRFDSTPGYFRSATQVCELDLLLNHSGFPPPPGAPAFDSPSKRTSFWTAAGLTGDNGRERLYAHIYPRVTTRSNTYTVHAWAQSIAKNPGTPNDQWDRFSEGKDRILGEYRGSTTIERFLDRNDDSLRANGGYDGAEANSKSLDPYFRFRIINHKRFTAQ